MVEESDRIIIVTGMMLSGTTILTYLLCQHPDVLCDIDDRRHLETRLLEERDEIGISNLIASTDKRVLMKAPQRQTIDLLWMCDAMPEARFLYTWKTFEAMQVSWAKPTAPPIPDTGQAYYEARLQEACEMESAAAHFRRVYYGDLLEQPGGILAEITDWFGLPDYSYDVSNVQPGASIKDILGGGPWPAGLPVIP